MAHAPSQASKLKLFEKGLITFKSMLFNYTILSKSFDVNECVWKSYQAGGLWVVVGDKSGSISELQRSGEHDFST